MRNNRQTEGEIKEIKIEKKTAIRIGLIPRR